QYRSPFRGKSSELAPFCPREPLISFHFLRLPSLRSPIASREKRRRAERGSDGRRGHPATRRAPSAALNACSFGAMSSMLLVRQSWARSRDFRGAQRRDARPSVGARAPPAQPCSSVSTLRAVGRFRRITTEMARARALLLALATFLALSGTASAQGGTLRVGLPTLSPTLDPATALEGPVSVIARQ